MRNLGLVVILAAGTATAAPAQDFKSMQLASDLGSVLASEVPCELNYDQSAIEAFIDENVAADDMGFASTLSMMTRGNEMEISEMGTSEKTAHCAQIRRVAKSYGFAD